MEKKISAKEKGLFPVRAAVGGYFHRGSIRSIPALGEQRGAFS